MKAFNSLRRRLTEGFPPREAHEPGLKGHIRYLSDVVAASPPVFTRIMKLQPLMALATSIFCILLLRKGYEYAPVVLVSALFAFFYLTFRMQIHRRGGVLPKVWDTALLFLINDMLLFAVPFYFESMTVPSVNMVFAPVLLLLAVLAHWYALYRRFILPYPVIGSFFYSLTIFCVLNLVFPVVFGMRNIWSLLVSGTIASLLVVLFINPHIPLLKGWKNTFLSLTGIIAFLALLWFGRSAIPPAPLTLVSAGACESIAGHSPVNSFVSMPAGTVDEVCFFSSISAPRGLKERMLHVWRHNGQMLFTVDIKDLYGGRKEGFRTWSRHRLMEGPGKYTVEVWTAGGQLVGERNFFLR